MYVFATIERGESVSALAWKDGQLYEYAHYRARLGMKTRLFRRVEMTSRNLNEARCAAGDDGAPQWIIDEILAAMRARHEDWLAQRAVH